MTKPSPAAACGCDGCETSEGDTTALIGTCPTCRLQGKRVNGTTVKAMLSVSLMELQDVPYYFCRDATCAVVYFSADRSHTFTSKMLRERVYQKERHHEDIWVCYCFRYTLEHIRAELMATHDTTVISAIEAGIHAGQCACELRNPQGSCCLGNVRSLVQELRQGLGAGPQTSFPQKGAL